MARMMLLTKDVEKRLPALYSQEKVDDPIVVVKFFDPCSSATWFVTEGQREGDDFLMFGLCYIHEPELGYVALSELQEYKGPLGIGIERDLYWTPVHLSEVREKVAS